MKNKYRCWPQLGVGVGGMTVLLCAAVDVAAQLWSSSLNLCADSVSPSQCQHKYTILSQPLKTLYNLLDFLRKLLQKLHYRSEKKNIVHAPSPHKGEFIGKFALTLSQRTSVRRGAARPVGAVLTWRPPHQAIGSLLSVSRPGYC